MIVLPLPGFPVDLVSAAPAHTHAVCAYFARNQAHLAPWEPLRPAGFYAPQAVRQRLENAAAEVEEDRSVQFLLWDRGQGSMVGACNFTGIARGASQSCHLGYSLDAQRQGRGLMTAALRRGIRFMFEQQALHRIMAAYLPHNRPSERLLQRLGFEREGYARAYLNIAGHWQDHVLTALIAPLDVTG